MNKINKKKALLIGAALTGMSLAAQAGNTNAKSKAPMAHENAKEEMVMCHGVNSCKGHGQCAGKVDSCNGKNGCDAKISCAGKNSCKGKGLVKLKKSECLKKGGTVAKS